MQTIRHVNHADDLKVSHVKPPIITRMASQLKGTCKCLFGDSFGAMQISRGKTHEHFGMTLDFTVPGEVKITMIPPARIKDGIHLSLSMMIQSPLPTHLLLNICSKSMTRPCCSLNAKQPRSMTSLPSVWTRCLNCRGIACCCSCQMT
jgi:hypothetical protein